MDSTARPLRELKTTFKALADVSRLRILLELAEYSEAGVSELAQALKSSQPLISWHLRTLRRAGVVSKRRSGRVSLYSLNYQRLQWCQDQLGLLIVGQLASGADAGIAHPVDNPV
jgi:DNA-binding transcriptional ArsR family regulator